MIWIWICIGLHFLWLHSFFSVFLRSSKHVCIADSCTCSETVGSESWEDWEERKYLHVLCDCCQWELRGLGGKNEVPACVVWLLTVKAERTGRKEWSTCMCCVTVDNESRENWKNSVKWLRVSCDSESWKNSVKWLRVSCDSESWKNSVKWLRVSCDRESGENSVKRLHVSCDRENRENWKNSVKWLYVSWQGEWGEVGEQCEVVACCVTGRVGRSGRTVWSGCMLCDRVERSGRGAWSGCLCHVTVDRTERTAMRR